MVLAELLDPNSRLLQHLHRRAVNGPEEVLDPEAGPRQSENVLLVQEHLREFDVVGDVLELLDVDLHHGVHGPLRLDHGQTVTPFQARLQSPRLRLQLQIKFLLKLLTAVIQSPRASLLRQMTRPQNDLTQTLNPPLQFFQPRPVKRKPPNPHPRNQILLRHTRTRHNRHRTTHLSAHLSQRIVLTTLEYHTAVHLITYNHGFMFFAHLHN
mmetsp:Transcript_25609/g.48121  ORF Transcript_25609/g.48121 Transcript_25609/m.48121 type:complete len:211 (-) Transcript_25609:617-1249(-)